MPNAILRHFEYAHLPADLQAVSNQFHALAHALERNLPDGPEKSVALRKLLEGKDAAVRAALPEPVAQDAPHCRNWPTQANGPETDELQPPPAPQLGNYHVRPDVEPPHAGKPING